MITEDMSEVRKELFERMFYIQLLASLTPKGNGGLADKEVKQSFIEMSSTLDSMSDTELTIRGEYFYELLQKAVKMSRKYFRPRKSIRVIGREFNELFTSGKSNYSIGIEFGWLNERIEFIVYPFPSYLPYHANVGLGHHANSISIEEEYLLRDAFFMLIQAEKTYNDMNEYYDAFKKIKDDIENAEEQSILSNRNQTVSTYSRLGVLSFYSFVESFINSIGYDFYLRNYSQLEDGEIDLLKGLKKGNFIKLESKIENIQKIIRNDKKAIIVVTDSKQLKEPFKSLFTAIKEIRDSSVHYSPLKEKIWYKPDDWIKYINKTAKTSIDAAIEFWSACYPDQPLPEYLHELNYDKHVKIAENRLEKVLLGPPI